MTVEKELARGNFASAYAGMTSISSPNIIEQNYTTFYDLYAKYCQEFYTSNDNNTLFDLANKCPFTDGEVIYKSRALYNMINTGFLLFNDNCVVESNSRLMNSSGEISHSAKWTVEIYPNPATNEFFIQSNNEKDELKIEITDVTGKLVLNELVKTNSFRVNLKLNLKDGVYFVNLCNQNNEKVTKKLVVTK